MPAQVQWVPPCQWVPAPRPAQVQALSPVGASADGTPKSSGRQPRCQPKPSGRQGQRTGQRRAIAYLTAKCTTPTPTPWPIFNASIQPINPTFQRFNSNSSERRWLADWSIIWPCVETSAKLSYTAFRKFFAGYGTTTFLEGFPRFYVHNLSISLT